MLSCPVSGALVCRSSWDDPVVQAKANFLIGADRVKVREEVVRHRLEALRSFKRAFGGFKQAEKLYYEGGSYYAGAEQ